MGVNLFIPIAPKILIVIMSCATLCIGGTPSFFWFINVWHCGGMSMVLLQLIERPLGTIHDKIRRE